MRYIFAENYAGLFSTGLKSINLEKVIAVDFDNDKEERKIYFFTEKRVIEWEFASHGTKRSAFVQIISKIKAIQGS